MIEVTSYAVMILMQFSSLEACEAYAMNLKHHDKCVKIISYEEPNNERPLKRPDIIKGMKI